MSKYFTTIGLHCGDFEMEILVESSIGTKEEAEKTGNSGRFHIGYLYEDRLQMKGEDLVIKKDETEKYQFRLCREWKPVVGDEDYEDLTWDEAIDYLINDRKCTLPHSLESYFYAVRETCPFKQLNTTS